MNSNYMGELFKFLKRDLNNLLIKTSDMDTTSILFLIGFSIVWLASGFLANKLIVKEYKGKSTVTPVPYQIFFVLAGLASLSIYLTMKDFFFPELFKKIKEK